MPLDMNYLNLDWREESALQVIEQSLNSDEFGRVAMVSSFGAESAVLLHLVSRINPDLPVIFIDTQMLFQETIDYQLALAEKFGLTNVQRIKPDVENVRRNDPFGNLHRADTDKCCDIRKIQPLDTALAGYDSWISGRKRHQTNLRATMDVFEIGEKDKLKINPLAYWRPEDIRGYLDRYDLPRHPLVEKGFPSIGCAPCTSAINDGEDPRAGRWRGQDKEECGIHFENGKVVRRPASAA